MICKKLQERMILGFGILSNVRTSMADYRKEERLINIPLYTIGNIEKIIEWN